MLGKGWTRLPTNASPVRTKRAGVQDSSTTFQVDNVESLVDVAGSGAGAGRQDVLDGALHLLDVEADHALLAADLLQLRHVDLPHVLNVHRPPLAQPKVCISKKKKVKKRANPHWSRRLYSIWMSAPVPSMDPPSGKFRNLRICMTSEPGNLSLPHSSEAIERSP